jgi:GNAT superfamily N-acetyltransferase
MIADAREIEFGGGILRLRPETVADEAFRFALFCASRPPEEDFSPLGPELAERLLHQQFRAQYHGYRANFPQARFDIIEFEDARVGHVVVDIADTQMRAVDLAILPERRSAGIGEAVLNRCLAEAQERNLPLRASVLNGNEGCLRLCRRLGFSPVGEPTALFTELEWRGV